MVRKPRSTPDKTASSLPDPTRPDHLPQDDSREPPRPEHPSGSDLVTVYIDDGELLKHTATVHSTLRRCGIRQEDLDDITQLVFFGAWNAILAGRFRVARDQAIPDAVRAWLTGIARWQATHALERVYHHKEILSSDPAALALALGAAEPQVPSPEPCIAARELLRGFDRLPPEIAYVLERFALGDSVSEIARALGISRDVVTARLHRGRMDVTARRKPS